MRKSKPTSARMARQTRHRVIAGLVAASLIVVAFTAMYFHAERPLAPSLAFQLFTAPTPYGGSLPWSSATEVDNELRWSSHSLSARTRAVRLGAMMVDIEAAARMRNMASPGAYYDRDPVALTVVDRTSTLVAGHSRMASREAWEMDEHASITPWLDQLAAHGDRRATFGHELRAIRATLWELPHPDMIILGSWLQAGRIAAQRADTGYFRTPANHEMDEWSVSLRHVSPGARVALRRLHELNVNQSSDFHAFNSALTHALHELTM